MKVTYSHISSLLQKFTPAELTALIPELFTEISWEEVISSIKKNRLSCQSKFIGMTTAALYEDSKPSKESLQYVYWALQFFDKIHHNNQDWHGIYLRSEVEDVSDTEHIQRNIVRAYRTEARDAEVMIKLDEDEDIIYIMTVEKKTSSKGIKYKRPFFFAHNHKISEPCGFYFPRFSGFERYLTYCCKGFGFENYEEIPLSGKDVVSLFGMIERDINNSKALQTLKNFKPVTVMEEDGVVDFTLSKQRARYAEIVFPGYTKLQTYTIRANNEWRGPLNELSELKGMEIDSSIRFTSTSPNVTVEDMFKEMIKRGIVQLPLPAYIANFPKIPKNNVELREDGSSNSSYTDKCNSADDSDI